jgi:hypothetical protein
MNKLMQDQLRAFAAVMKQILDDQDLKHYEAESEGLMSLYGQYVNDSSRVQLETLRERSTLLPVAAAKLGFAGYGVYMVSSGLKLTVLQQRIKQVENSNDHSNLSGVRQNFVNERKVAIAYHAEMVKYIDEQTEPAEAVKRLISPAYLYSCAEPPYPFSWCRLSGRVLNTDVAGLILSLYERGTPRWATAAETFDHVQKLNGAYEDVPGRDLRGNPIRVFAVRGPEGRSPIPWLEIRREVKKQSTDVGAVMVDRWKEASPKGV